MTSAIKFDRFLTVCALGAWLAIGGAAWWHVSTLGRFEKRGGDEFVLTGYFGLDGLSREEAVREIKDRCGWALQVADDVCELAPATSEELALLRLFDPERFFLGKPAESIQSAVPAK